MVKFVVKSFCFCMMLQLIMETSRFDLKPIAAPFLCGNFVFALQLFAGYNTVHVYINDEDQFYKNEHWEVKGWYN